MQVTCKEVMSRRGSQRHSEVEQADKSVEEKHPEQHVERIGKVSARRDEVVIAMADRVQGQSLSSTEPAQASAASRGGRDQLLELRNKGLVALLLLAAATVAFTP